jgi:hypothetical protein
MALNHPNLVGLGRPALVLLPMRKYDQAIRGWHGKTPDALLREYCTLTFNAISIQSAHVKGEWRDADDNMVSDTHQEYRVAFVRYVSEQAQEDRLMRFVDFLSRLCKAMGEDCLYVEFGEQAYLINPN